MDLKDDELKGRLLAEDDEYRKLHEEHRGCDEKLHGLTRKSFLNGNEQIEEKMLKKQKLLLKDRMEAIKVRYESEVLNST